MEKNRTEDIIKNYEKTEKNFTRTGKNTKYLEKLAEIKDIQVEQNRVKIHIENLEKEEKGVSDKALKEEYQRQIAESKKELEDRNAEIEKLENEKQEMLVQKKRDERVLRENIKRQVNELQDKTRKELMGEKQSLDAQISSKKIELEEKKNELDKKKMEESQFVYSYSENNGQDLRKLREETQRVEKETKKLSEELNSLESLSNRCEDYRQKLVTPFKMPPELPDDKIYLGYEKEKEQNTDKKTSDKQKDEKTNNEVEDKNVFETNEIINNVKSDMEKENKNYSNIHLDPNEKIQENPINGATRKNDKNVFETNNIINNVKKDMGLETENTIKPNTRETKAESNAKGSVQQISPTGEKDKEEKSSNKITYIGIYESEGKIFYQNEKGEKGTISIAEVLESKKSQFSRLDIKNICKEIAGGKIKGLLLGRKVNPEIVSVLQHDPEQLKDYITCIYQKKELPFELTHHLRGIGILDKIRLNKFARSEEKLGAIVMGKLFDKNRALDGVKDNKMLNAAKEGFEKGVTAAKEKAIRAKDKAKDFVQKIPNEDNHIEEKANEAIKQSQEQTAKDVQEIMNQNDKEEVK